MLDLYQPVWARRFDDAATDKLQCAVAVKATDPLTLACWFNSDDATLRQFLMMVADSATNNERFSLELRGDLGGDILHATAEAGGAAGTAATTTGYQAGKWHHACAVFISSVSRHCYLDGGGKGSNTTGRLPTSLDKTVIGRFSGSTDSLGMSGLICWPAAWSVDLTDLEVYRLSQGVPPWEVRPESLLAVWEFQGRNIEYDRKAAFPLTNTGSVPVPAPAFLRSRVPRRGLWGAVGTQAAAAGLFNVFRSSVVRGA